MRVFILTGEPSGDLHGAHLARALRALDPTIEIAGVGGTRMIEAGVQVVINSEHWGAIGIAEALTKVPLLLRRKLQLVKLLRADPPDVLITIDFGYFNVRVIRDVRSAVRRILYYIPPGCWSRQRAAGRLPFMVDAIATPFPWSAENLRAAHGTAQIEWVGHPLLDYCHSDFTRAQARELLSLPADLPVVAVIPGSRSAELKHILPTFLATVKLLKPKPSVLITVAPSLGEARVRAMVPPGMEVRLLRGIDYDLLQAADAALVTSGTATLELAILGMPMVIAYRTGWLTNIQIRILLLNREKRGLRYIGLPNILADAPIVPELIQESATPELLANALTPLLTDTEQRRAQLTGFHGMRQNLGEAGAVERTAKMVMGLGG